MLKQRIATGVLMVALFLCSLFVLPATGFFIFVSVAVLIGAWEWSNLSGFGKKRVRLIYCSISAALMVAAGIYTHVLDSIDINQEAIRQSLLFAGAWWAVALLWVQGYPTSSALWGYRWVKATMGWFVLLPSWLALIYLYQANNGPWLILLVVSVVIAADTGAYFFGRLFGKRKLAKDVSPGKSWEGFFGGVLCCFILSILLAWQTDFNDWRTILLIIIPTALVSVLGDLFESMMKRHRGIKDSGVILPGHGGVLDRLDSLTAAVPIFALAVLLTGWTL